MIHTKPEIIDKLNILIDRCEEGYSGEWDTISNGDVFISIINTLKDIKKYVKTTN